MSRIQHEAKCNRPVIEKTISVPLSSEVMYDYTRCGQNIKHRNNVCRHENLWCAGEKEKVKYRCGMCKKILHTWAG